MAEFAYNNSKNASMSHTPFMLNCGYHTYVFFKNECDVYSRSFSAERLAIELKKLINVYRQNLLYIQDLQKQVYDKRVKPWSYAPGEKFWLNSKHIKIKRNWKLKAKFFELFQMFYLVGKQAYKLELSAR